MGIGHAVDDDQARPRKRQFEQVVNRVGLRGTARGRRIRVVVIHHGFEVVISNEGVALLLVIWRDVNAHVQYGQTIDGAFPGFVILANVGDRRTDGRVARASGWIEELGKNDVPRKVC